MKTCKDCRTSKPLSEFYTHTNGYAFARCKPCHSKRQKSRRAVIKKREGICSKCGEIGELLKNTRCCHKCWNKKQREMNPKYIKLKRDYVDSFKDKPCADCGVQYPPYVMDFDHRDPTEKKFAVSKMVLRRCKLQDIASEIAKCDLVCANCHRERHHGETE